MHEQSWCINVDNVQSVFRKVIANYKQQYIPEDKQPTKEDEGEEVVG